MEIMDAPRLARIEWVVYEIAETMPQKDSLKKSNDLRASVARLLEESKRLREAAKENAATAKKLVERIAEIEEQLLQKERKAK